MLSIRQVHINNTSHTNGGIEHILHSSSSLSSMTMTDDTIKEHHQHQHQQHIHYDDRHPLPTTVSMDSSERSGGSGTTINTTQSDISDISPYPLSLSTVAPITGQLSNILDDYIVFPTIIGEGSFGCVRECFARRSSTSSNMLYAVKSIEKSKVRKRAAGRSNKINWYMNGLTFDWLKFNVPIKNTLTIFLLIHSILIYRSKDLIPYVVK